MKRAPTPGVIWIFGYGSLIWRPGFSFTRRHTARLEGWHRAFCRYSFHHRGTPEAPGLVVGLRPGKTCVGIAFAVEAAGEAQALATLDTREGEGYLRRKVTVTLLDEGAATGGTNTATTEAWTYIPNREHPSYFGEEGRGRLVPLVAMGRGKSGAAIDYLRDLISHLNALGVEEPDLAAILADAERYRRANGAGIGTDAGTGPAG